MTPATLNKYNSSVASPPTATVPYWHHMCSCGKPVKPEDAWFNGTQQVHFNCLTQQPGVDPYKLGQQHAIAHQQFANPYPELTAKWALYNSGYNKTAMPGYFQNKC